MLFIGQLFIFRKQSIILRPQRKNLLILRALAAGGKVDFILFIASTFQLPARHKVRVAAKQNIRTAAGHVRGDRHGAQTACLRHDLRLLGMMLGIQHLMLNAPAAQHIADFFADFHRNGSYQHRLARLMAGDHFLHYCIEFILHGFIQPVIEILADHGLIGGNANNVQSVNALEFLFLGLSGTGHARKLFVHSEIILIGNGGKRLVFLRHLHVFLGFNGLVQTLAVPPALQNTAGKFIYDLDLPVIGNYIVAVALKEEVCF